MTTVPSSSISSAAQLCIECSDQPLDLSFHPSKPTLVAAALVDGTCEMHDFAHLCTTNTDDKTRRKNTRNSNSSGSNNHIAEDEEEEEEDTIVSSTEVHTQRIPGGGSSGSTTTQASCRTIRFAKDGEMLWTGGSMGDLVALRTELISTLATAAAASSSTAQNSSSSSSSTKAIHWRTVDATHGKSAVHVIHQINPTLWAVGDEAGAVRLWDSRLMGTQNNTNNTNMVSSTKKLPTGCVNGWKVHQDFVSAFEQDEAGTTLLATSGDGTLSVYDIRMNTTTIGSSNSSSSSPASQRMKNANNTTGLVRQSDHQEDELLSIQLMKNGKKVVCGTGEGVLAVFSYGTWGDVSDRFPGHPSSVETLVKIDEDTLLTGSSDGLIRVVTIHPDKFLGVLGDNHEGFPIEKLQFNANRNFVGSVTHDNIIRLFDAQILRDEEGDDDNEDDDADAEYQNDNQVEGGDVKMGTTTAVETTTNTNDGDDWEDMDEDSEEDDSDMDDNSNEDPEPSKSKNDKRAGRLRSDCEKFYDDI